MERFAATLWSDLASLRPLRRALTEWLEETAAVPIDARDAIVLAVHEAAANGIQHATAGSSVTVDGRVFGDRVVVDVASAGRWGERGREASEVTGRGLTLMHALVSEMEIDTQPERTTVRLQVRRTQTRS